LQSPLLEDPDAAVPCIVSAAASYVEAMRRIQAEGPYTVGGWSLGGLFAYAIAVQLEREGEQVDLVLIDPPPPGESAGLSTQDPVTEIDEAFGQAVLDPSAPPGSDQHARSTPPSPYMAAPAFDQELVRRRSAFARISSSIASHELPRFGGRAVLYQASSGQPGVRARAAEAFASACSSIIVRVLNGDHHGLLVAPRVIALAQTLRHDFALRDIDGVGKP
jgi:thioesterase domain-containing protein